MFFISIAIALIVLIASGGILLGFAARNDHFQEFLVLAAVVLTVTVSLWHARRTMRQVTARMIFIRQKVDPYDIEARIGTFALGFMARSIPFGFSLGIVGAVYGFMRYSSNVNDALGIAVFAICALLNVGGTLVVVGTLAFLVGVFIAIIPALHSDKYYSSVQWRNSALEALGILFSLTISAPAIAFLPCIIPLALILDKNLANHVKKG